MTLDTYISVKDIAKGATEKESTVADIKKKQQDESIQKHEKRQK